MNHWNPPEICDNIECWDSKSHKVNYQLELLIFILISVPVEKKERKKKNEIYNKQKSWNSKSLQLNHYNNHKFPLLVIFIQNGYINISKDNLQVETTWLWDIIFHVIKLGLSANEICLQELVPFFIVWVICMI